jgi:hypothetical protein
MGRPGREGERSKAGPIRRHRMSRSGTARVSTETSDTPNRDNTSPERVQTPAKSEFFTDESSFNDACPPSPRLRRMIDSFRSSAVAPIQTNVRRRANVVRTRRFEAKPTRKAKRRIDPLLTGLGFGMWKFFIHLTTSAPSTKNHKLTITSYKKSIPKLPKLYDITTKTATASNNGWIL